MKTPLKFIPRARPKPTTTPVKSDDDETDEYERVSVQLLRSEVAELKKLAKREDRSVSSIIRLFVRQVLQAAKSQRSNG